MISESLSLFPFISRYIYVLTVPLFNPICNRESGPKENTQVSTVLEVNFELALEGVESPVVIKVEVDDEDSARQSWEARSFAPQADNQVKQIYRKV